VEEIHHCLRELIQRVKEIKEGGEKMAPPGEVADLRETEKEEKEAERHSIITTILRMNGEDGGRGAGKKKMPIPSFLERGREEEPLRAF